jgi:hypothetical protein
LSLGFFSDNPFRIPARSFEPNGITTQSAGSIRSHLKNGFVGR